MDGVVDADKKDNEELSENFQEQVLTPANDVLKSLEDVQKHPENAASKGVRGSVSIDIERGSKGRLNVCLDNQIKDLHSAGCSKRRDHIIQIDFGESSAFEIRETLLTAKEKESSDECDDDLEGKPHALENIIDKVKSDDMIQDHDEMSQSPEEPGEAESQHEKHETGSSVPVDLQKNAVNVKTSAETSNKKRTINMIVSDILKSKETNDKEKADDLNSKEGSGVIDTRKESQPKKRRKAKNPVNIAHNEDGQCVEEEEEEEESFKCEICLLKFSRQIDLADHYMMHKDDGDFGFVYNGMAFETTADQQDFIESYVYSKLKGRSSVEEDGSVTFNHNIPENEGISEYFNQSDMGEGSELVKTDSENPLQCDYCDKAFSSTLLLKRHVSVHTGERPYKCDVCGKTFNLPHHLKTHARIHTNVRPYKCEVCGRAFNESSSLKRHTRIHAEERPYIYVCDVCGKTFNEPHNLRTHLRIHSDVKPYTCGVCKKAFIRQQTLKNHMRIHTDERPYKCEVCEKAFKELHHLKIHVRIHTDIRPYKCDICEKTFNERSSLKRHIRIHTGEKPYKCTLCDKAFNHNESLKIHYRHHTGERPFKCEICDKTFTDPKNYKSHQKIHSYDMKFKCDSCDKSFAEESRLWQHMRIHTGDLPFKCMICSKAFNQSSSLKRHLRTIHPGIDLADRDLFSSNPDEMDEMMDSPDEDFEEEEEEEESLDDLTGPSDVINEPPETSTSFHIIAEKA